MSPDWFANAFATLFFIVDPIGLAPIFLALTQGMTQTQRRSVALRASIAAAGILTVFAVAGGPLLDVLGITLPAFRIAGGLLLFWTAAEMIFEKRQERKKTTAEQSIGKDRIQQIAIFPLAIPLMSGPGAISATVLIASDNATLLSQGFLIAIVCLIISICHLIFMLAEKIDRLLGETGRTILSRLLGVLLAALSVQFVADGIIDIAQGV